ncbi:MAG: hypothetical protein K5668_07485 [Lachnospiraceae bacterium]|nr:hypothetical protein [Lachnospiraceae bacterium]
MNAGRFIGGILVCACVALVFVFTLKSLLTGDIPLIRKTGNDTAAEASAAAPEESTAAPEETVTAASREEEPAVTPEEAPAEEPEEIPEPEGYDPEAVSYDTMGDGTIPGAKEDYIVESTRDFKEFWDNGRENYLAFKHFTIRKTYENTQDTVCGYFVDLAFGDGSSLEGLRCNDVSALTGGRKFRYGYVRDDATQGNGQNVMYLYLVQE